MTDQPKPCKFKCFLKGFLIFTKWLIVLILTLLLIAGLYFQAPWKVLVLLTIFLCAMTILPKRFRKYFWLTTACAVVVLTIWVFLPEDNTGWKQYTLDDELAALNAKHKIPDNQNAAIIFEQFCQQYEDEQLEHSLDIDREIESLLRSEPWKSEDYPELADWLSQNEPVFEPIFEAANLSKSSFQYAVSKDGIDSKIRVLSKIQKLSKMLEFSACNDFAEGRIDLALKKNRTILTVGRHFQQGQPLVHHILGYGIEHRALRQLYAFIIEGQLNHDQLQYIGSYLSSPQDNWQQIWLNSIEFEKLYFKNGLLSKNYEVNDEDKVRFSRSADMLSFPMLLRYMGVKNDGKLNTIIKWFYMPSSAETFTGAMNIALAKYDEMGNSDYTWPDEMEDFSINQMYWDAASNVFANNSKHIERCTSISYPGFKKIHEIYLEIRSKRNAVRICLALQKFKRSNGRWPRNLDSIKSLVPTEILVDPTNDSAYVYERNDDSFLLYSKGINGIDENGGYYRRRDDALRTYDYQFWPPKTRLKEEQEKIDLQGEMQAMPGMGMPGMLFNK